MKDARIYQLALAMLEGVGPVIAKKLIAYCGGAEEIFGEKVSSLAKIPGIGEIMGRNIVQQKKVLDAAEEELNYIIKNNIETFFFTDKNYSKRLKECDDGPVLLFGTGTLDLNASKFVAIVGTRNASNYGKGMVEEIVSELAPLQVVIVSGLAYGIDVTAHREAMKRGIPTIGVLGHSLDHIYPASHSNVSKKMQENGGIISEYFHNTKAEREHFPMRNRIIAGLSDVILVVESAASGGSMITAKLGNDYNRDVFAVPGRIHDSSSEGCLNLIKNNQAGVFTSTEDLIKYMNWEEAEKKSIQSKLFIDLNPAEKILVDLLKDAGECSIDVISAKSKIPMSQTAGHLLNLEFNGVIKSLPGKVYTLT